MADSHYLLLLVGIDPQLGSAGMVVHPAKSDIGLTSALVERTTEAADLAARIGLAFEDKTDTAGRTDQIRGSGMLDRAHHGGLVAEGGIGFACHTGYAVVMELAVRTGPVAKEVGVFGLAVRTGSALQVADVDSVARTAHCYLAAHTVRRQWDCIPVRRSLVDRCCYHTDLVADQ